MLVSLKPLIFNYVFEILSKFIYIVVKCCLMLLPMMFPITTCIFPGSLLFEVSVLEILKVIMNVEVTHLKLLIICACKSISVYHG